jgi:sulfofructose kinase
MTATWDVLGLGCTAIDDLFYVPAYPEPDSKIQFRRKERQCGGLTGTALVAAARLGSCCAFAGALGSDEMSRLVLDRFTQEGIDTRHTRRRPDARPAYAVIIVDESEKTRTILSTLEGCSGAEPDWPKEEVLRACRVLFVDHIGVEGMIRAARIARHAGIPVVADLENDQDPKFGQLLALVDHLIVSRDFAAKLTGQSDPAEAARKLWTPQRKVAAVTFGDEGCWYVTNEGLGIRDGGLGMGNRREEGESRHAKPKPQAPIPNPQHPAPRHAPPAPRYQPAFPVDVVDTTGCGDVFHGAYASALARGLDVAGRIEFASAAAALKATKPGGQSGIPTRPAVEAFIRGSSAPGGG